MRHRRAICVLEEVRNAEEPEVCSAIAVEHRASGRSKQVKEVAG